MLSDGFKGNFLTGNFSLIEREGNGVSHIHYRNDPCLDRFISLRHFK